VMGGAVTGQGNTTASAEFNIGFDPEAAHIVFEAFERIEVVDWEAVMRHGFAHAEFEHWLQSQTPQARFYDSISRKTRNWAAERRGERWHSADALAMAVALQPVGVLETVDRPLAIELDGGLARGATIVDWQRRSGRPDNARILVRYDQPRFEGMIRAALGTD
ncbi:MAG: nucleoside hydrolase, partial [Luteimonas sp.]